MTREISNSDDVIDSRDVIARIEELEAYCLPVHNVETGDDQLDPSVTQEERAEMTAELAALKSLADEAEHYASDWEHGATLIRDSNFVDYCEELVKDIGDLPNDIPGYLAIDWETTAENLKVDYSSVEFDGVTYWIR